MPPARPTGGGPTPEDPTDGGSLCPPAEASGFVGGDGAETNRYIICSRSQLKAIEGDLTKHYALLGNIDLGDIPFEPIDGEFIGSLDGRGFRIQNLRIEDNNQNVALFRHLGRGNDPMIDRGYIRDLGIEGVYVENTSNADQSRTAGLVAYLRNGLIGSSYVIDNDPDIDIQASTRTKSTARNDEVGGLVGGSDIVTLDRIISSYTQVDIHGGEGKQPKVGGLIGYSNGTEVVACYSRSNVTGSTEGGSAVGGLMGRGDGIQIAGSYALGNVSGGGGSNRIGGLVGEASAGSQVRSSYAYTTLTNGGLDIGPLAGSILDLGLGGTSSRAGSWGMAAPGSGTLTNMVGVPPPPGYAIEHPIILSNSLPAGISIADDAHWHGEMHWEYPGDATAALGGTPPPTPAELGWTFVPIIRYATSSSYASGSGFVITCDPDLAAQLLPTGACGTDLIPGQEEP